jgi:hypothetical protein
MISRQFAQVTSLPSTGGSSAQDFQPTTQNPQAVRGNLQQPGATGQSTSGQDVLNNQNARIIVPVNPANPPSATTTQLTAMNWWPIFVVLFLLGIFLCGLIYYFTRKKMVTSIIYEEEIPPQESALPVRIPVQEKITSPVPTPKKAKAKKSKSKRKKSRK